MHSIVNTRVFKYEILLTIFQAFRLALVFRKNNFMSLCKPTIHKIKFGRIIASFLSFLLLFILKIKKEGSRLAVLPILGTELLLYSHQLFKGSISPIPALWALAFSVISQFFLKTYEYKDSRKGAQYNIGFQRYHLNKPKFNLSVFYPTLDQLTAKNRINWLVEKNLMYHPYLSMKDIFKEKTGLHLPRFPFKVALHFLSKITLPVINNPQPLPEEFLFYREPLYPTIQTLSSIPANFRYPDISSRFKKKPNKAKTAFKIMIYCHGFSAHANSSFFLFQELCSNGWIIISIDFEESLKVKSNPEEEIALRASQLLKRVETVQAVISLLYREKPVEYAPELHKITYRNPVLNHICEGKIKVDLDNLVVLGHSMGGATAILTAQQDPRVKVCVALDPAFMTLPEEFKKKTIECPLLVISCWKFFRVLLNSMKNDNELGEFFKVAHPYENYNINCYLKGSPHISQTDFDTFIPGETRALGMTYNLDDLEFLKEANIILINLFLENVVNKPKKIWKSGEEILRNYEEILYQKTGRRRTLFSYDELIHGKVRIE